MKIKICSVLLLVVLGESYGKTTATVNHTSTSWGYDYSLNDTDKYKIKPNVNGYQLEPIYNNTSSSLKKHYNSKSVYDKFTSPGTNTGQSEGRSDVTDGYANSRSNSAEPHEVNRQTNAPIVPSPSQGIVSGDTNGYPRFPANGPIYRTTFGTTYSLQNTPMYTAPAIPLYYPQTTAYGQTYGPTAGSMYGMPNGQVYSSPPLVPTVPMYGYGPQNGQMYRPQNGQTYYPTGQSYGSYRNY